MPADVFPTVSTTFTQFARHTQQEQQDEEPENITAYEESLDEEIAANRMQEIAACRGYCGADFFSDATWF